jgi:hypothetical protein
VHRHGGDGKIDIKTGRGARPECQCCSRCEHASEIAERNQPPGPNPKRSRYS